MVLISGTSVGNNQIPQFCHFYLLPVWLAAFHCSHFTFLTVCIIAELNVCSEPCGMYFIFVSGTKIEDMALHFYSRLTCIFFQLKRNLILVRLLVFDLFHPVKYLIYL